MQIDDRVELLAPIGTKFISIQQSLGLQPFAEEVLAFLADLSQMLRADPRVRALPDLYSFGFWCRRTSLEKMRREYPRMDCRLGRGLVFHVGPSNVPVNFAYSLVAGLLAGNANIVRVPSADFLQVRILAQILNELLCNPLYISLREYIRLVRYSRNAEDITAIFSNICDVRVIWGGDSTINNIRQQHLPARAFDVTFADRYSACIIGAKRYLIENKTTELAKGFYNDTFLFDQNACTAPHLVLWHGDAHTVKEARQVFWSMLYKVAFDRYKLDPIRTIEKFSLAMHFAALHEGTTIVPSTDMLITRISLKKLEPDIDKWKGNSGLFFEYESENLDEIIPIITRRYQTLSYTGIDKRDLQTLVIGGRASGIDRIVPIGRTLEFSLDWDGHDLIRTLSRQITIN